MPVGMPFKNEYILSRSPDATGLQILIYIPKCDKCDVSTSYFWILFDPRFDRSAFERDTTFISGDIVASPAVSFLFMSLYRGWFYINRDQISFIFILATDPPQRPLVLDGNLFMNTAICGQMNDARWFCFAFRAVGGRWLDCLVVPSMIPARNRKWTFLTPLCDRPSAGYEEETELN